MWANKVRMENKINIDESRISLEEDIIFRDKL